MRKSAKMLKVGHYVITGNERESRVEKIAEVDSEYGVMYEITLANGETIRRTSDAKLNVSRLK